MVADITTQNEPIEGQHGIEDTHVGGFNDRRARLSAKPDARKAVYGSNHKSNILHPIWHAGGLLWPYTPIINDNATVNYETYDPVHTNQPFATFKSVGIKDIMCSGNFTAQNEEEGLYCLAVMHFLRTITKMYFGVGGDSKAVALRGTPPPVLLFNAHGAAMFHNVPVVVHSYMIELPQDVDYINVKTPPIVKINSPVLKSFRLKCRLSLSGEFWTYILTVTLNLVGTHADTGEFIFTIGGVLTLI